MKLIFTLMFTFFSFFQSDLESLRNSYSKANQSNENAKNFIELAEKKNSSDIMISAYKAAAKVLEAKVTTEKNKRKSFVKSGATSLESLIKSNPNNAELRVIRMSVQENIPKIVGYNKNLKEDKSFLISNYSKQNAALKSYIKQFAAQSKTITAAEKASFK
ncbi:hypothetical protein NG800_008735 [Epilithonimonas ginsengisoli]|uniref:DUF4142 domain-containing protein n=1 Tax=Epilithonimonas ginsengisoli TaxID=1245592 RepID=A0ABU4JH36_9FLAO|nr:MULTISPECIES: hypothetical protein [Chryseobacterium group]MBV6880370.1 hypothetical protein [Epilithonimonas sp. FP105]MDW8548996.1 hypothetical protein [Epilithonimonas ginsengisoli]OAH74775.1 hypothetical protein AXA65_05980 [Chryseobacterium sp. FP211-J200]